ncbi:hypothetical protein [Nocardioides alcanivorans]|uniref:hypothetical protein n=1 Tax=Nocardioides alcanivorans TaxID=2897352 RepID=UPI001F1D0FC3|nr:hypothetical protein [Nocardioides alcanivorans]
MVETATSTSAIKMVKSGTSVASWSGVVDGVILPDPKRLEQLSSYLSAGGYRALSSSGRQRVHGQLADSPAVRELRGRGGAGFRYWDKIVSVRSAARRTGRTPVVVGNGAEGEPLSVKDRYLMRHRPHLVLDGLALTAAAVGAAVAHLYVADPVSRETLRRALDEVGTRLGLDVQVHAAQETYVSGESSAVVRAITSGIARPTAGPPRPHQVGLGDAPTVVSNVETLARVARALLEDPPHGDAPVLLTLTSALAAPILVEVPQALSVATVLNRFGIAGGSTAPALLAGGFFGGVLPLSDDLACSWDSFADHGGGLGCCSLYIIPDAAEVPGVVAQVATYYARNNAGQCRVCMNATRDIAHHLTDFAPPSGRLRNLGGDPEQELTRWSTQLVGRGPVRCPTVWRRCSARPCSTIQSSCAATCPGPSGRAASTRAATLSRGRLRRFVGATWSPCPP